MRTFSFVTVDVFTDRRFGGNPLAVFPDARGLSDDEMQSLAAEFNLSETTFVLPPADPANTARVRIFNRTAEMPFAGHPNVGTGWVLAGMGRARDGLLRFEEIAGLVEVRTDGSGTVTIAAPQPLSLAEEMPADLVAGLRRHRRERGPRSAHRPVAASVGNAFVIAEVTPDALTRAAPDLSRFKAAHEVFPFLGPRRLPLYLYAHDGKSAEATRLRARMFAPLSGTIEDAATGSAATPWPPCCCRSAPRDKARYDITQGVEMGRPSLLACTAWRARRTASAPASAAAACRC